MDKGRNNRSAEILVQDDTYILCRESEEDKKSFLNLCKESFALTNRMPDNMFQDFFEKYWKDRRQGNSLYISVFRKQDFAYLGNIMLKALGSETPELGIDVAKVYQRNGVAYNTLKMFMNWASETYQNIEYFFIRIYSDNVASLNLFQKLGAIYMIGCLRYFLPRFIRFAFVPNYRFYVLGY